ncbi:Phospholipid/glycerol acyltransferase [metagenome]|uniref:Phospholipid/glycerol acyltransferase n=1 Tax=metagenome TaxID=256318 RepID=A0A2P2CHL4_9ZZZZ
MPEDARENAREDAVVIPIGTGGRPGRGTGRARPSSAARNLALAARKPPAGSSAKPTKPAAAKKKATKAAPRTATPVAEVTPEQAVHPAEEGAAPREATRTSDRGPGIPVGDWLSAAQGAAREVFGDDWERRLAELMAFVRRRLEGDYEVDDYGFDRELTERFFMAALRPIAEKWFRLEVRGLDNIPAEGGALVVSNHSGTVPLDGLMTMLTVHDHAHRFLRPLGADLVFKLPVVSSLARKGGATLACIEDAERMLSGGDLVGVWPEGFKGIGKPFSERYKLQRFGRGGFVSAALRTGVPIIPLSVVGAEEIYPLVGNMPSLARLLGVPYIPITPFFPWLGPLGMVPLPSKWILEFGEPIRTDAYDPAEAEDPMLVFNVTDQVRETIQHTLFALLRDRDGVFG